jgi:hypothetical protein
MALGGAFPGACAPKYLVPEGSRATLMPGSCMAGELCVPCVNPLTMMPTGVCR